MIDRTGVDTDSCAKKLAQANVEAEIHITGVWHFPSTDEIRLVETDETAAPSDNALDPFYFAPDPKSGIPFPSGIAIIRPDEFGNLALPEGWGSWKDAKRIYGKD